MAGLERSSITCAKILEYAVMSQSVLHRYLDNYGSALRIRARLAERFQLNPCLPNPNHVPLALPDFQK